MLNNCSYLFIITLLLFSSAALFAQQKEIITTREYPRGYFAPAMKIAPQASGTFGELRSTHFHGGDDYRTQQRTGIPIHSIAEGFVSRVRVQIGGGGNAVYIDHPNGYTSVYMHMSGFNDKIARSVKEEQYKQKRFDVDLELKPNQISLNKGDVIGKSGNTGASSGPHMHLEIRETKSQNPLNPQLFGLHFPDRIPPTISRLVIYDRMDKPFSEHTPRRNQALRSLGNGKYDLSHSTPVSVNGIFGIGIASIDKHNGTSFNHGIYSIEVFLDNENISTVLFEELDFETTRAIHAYIDYPTWVNEKVKVQKTFKDPNNPLDIFYTLKNRGLVQLNDQKVHDVKIIVKDVHANTSELNFKVKQNDNFTPKATLEEGVKQFLYNQKNEFQTENVRVEMEKGVLYDDLNFQYTQSPAPSSAFSASHKIHNLMTPLYNPYTLAIKAVNLPENLRDKALIVSSYGVPQGGEYQEGWVTTKLRTFGDFYITTDTTPPTIRPRNLSDGKNLSTQSRIDFTIDDNLSGIQSFNGYIDGEWVLMEYDSKNKHLWHTFEPHLSKGKHTFELVVKDRKDNEKRYKVNFIK